MDGKDGDRLDDDDGLQALKDSWPMRKHTKRARERGPKSGMTPERQTSSRAGVWTAAQKSLAYVDNYESLPAERPAGRTDGRMNEKAGLPARAPTTSRAEWWSAPAESQSRAARAARLLTSGMSPMLVKERLATN